MNCMNIELSSFANVPAKEQESVIRWEANEKEFCFYTCDKSEIKKILKMMSKYPDELHVIQKDKYGIEVIFPRKWLSIRPPRKGRPMTEEQKELLKLGHELAAMK